DLRDQLSTRTNALTDALRDSELPLPARVIDGARNGMEHRLERRERLRTHPVKRREQDTMTQIGTARGALFPLGTRQERALNIIPFVARHGLALIDRITAEARH